MLWVKLFNLVLLLGLVIWFTRRKINQYFQMKREQLESQIQSAAEDLEAIEKEYNEVSRKMENIEAEISDLRAQAKKDLEAESLRIKEETEAFVKKIFRDNSAKMEQAIEKTKRNFRDDLVASALSSARDELIARNAKQDAQWTAELLEAGESMEGKKEYAS